MAAEITERNHPGIADVDDADLPDTALILEALHRIDHRTAEMAAELGRWKPILDQFRAHGLLAARRAARGQ